MCLLLSMMGNAWVVLDRSLHFSAIRCLEQHLTLSVKVTVHFPHFRSLPDQPNLESDGGSSQKSRATPVLTESGTKTGRKSDSKTVQIDRKRKFLVFLC